MENQTQYLPHELILEILLRLPVKSLIRFKCVCKLWLTFISNPNFANSHFQLATTSNTHTRRILFISNSPLLIRSKDFASSLNNDSASLNLSFMHPHSSFRLEIKGSCRGFIFLHCRSDLYIWNPSTGVHKQIPSSPFISKLKEHYFGLLYGFGYDESRDDYLVVSMSCDIRTSYLNLFSLRDNTWVEIEGTHVAYRDASCNNKEGLLFNGAIHWFAYSRDYLLVDLIVAFNLMERKLLEIPVPYDFDHIHRDCGLWVFGELLGLWAMDNNYNDTIEIWVMKEYKLHSSWTKTLVLLIDDAIPNFYPICSIKSGDIIGTDGGFGLVKYNDKGKLLEYHSDNNYPGRSKTIMYTESLLSLPLDGEQV